MAVTSRQFCPTAMPTMSPFGSCATPTDAPRLMSFKVDGPVMSDPGPPEMISTTYIAPIATSRSMVADARRRTFATAIRRPGPLRNSRRASSTHSGHWCPTGAGIMHSGQIGRPHRVQWTPVSTFGCR